MAEMQWYAATDSGRFDGTAAITPRSGAVCLRAELPAGVLQNAVAALPWTMAHEEKLFMNGYQTWTACPELGKWDRQHGVERVPKFLLEKYSFDRYGDYHFVPYSGKRGQSHGFSYCYFRRGKTYRLLASLDEAPGYTIFSYDSLYLGKVRAVLSIKNAENMASLQKNYPYRKKKEKYQEISDMVLIDDFLFFSQPGKISGSITKITV